MLAQLPILVVLGNVCLKRVNLAYVVLLLHVCGYVVVVIYLHEHGLPA